MPRMDPTRRLVLQSLAALPLTLPLARLLRADPRQPPTRLVLVMQNNGTQQKNFWPGPDLSSRILDDLFLDPATGRDNGLRSKTNLVKGVYVPSDANGTNGNEHDMGFARMFTGEKLISRGGQPWGGGMSVDQMVARAWNVDTLTLAVLASQSEPYPKPGFDHRESFSYLGPATLKHPRRDPREVFRRLFPPADARLGRRLSVLDAVSANLAETGRRLGPAERHKLDHHVTAMRAVERRLNEQLGFCAARPTPPPDYLAIDPNAEINTDRFIPQMVDNMMDLAAVALTCGMTRIATVQLGYGGGKWRFAWEGIDMECHGDVAHLDTSDDGSSLENTRRVVLMNRYYARCVRRLALHLDAVPEGGGTMLDHTLIVWANELGRGDHSQENIPIVLIGRAGGAIPTGGRVLDSGRQLFNRLGCTVLNAMGIPAAGFGDVPDCGVFPGLLR